MNSDAEPMELDYDERVPGQRGNARNVGDLGFDVWGPRGTRPDGESGSKLRALQVLARSTLAWWRSVRRD